MSRAQCEVCGDHTGNASLYRCPEPRDRIDLSFWCEHHLLWHLVNAHAWNEDKARAYLDKRRKINDAE